MPSLAIAIPTLNRAAMLDGILRDLIPQALAAGVSVCVSDNGSRDHTPEVCARHAARYPEVRFQRHPSTLPMAESLMSVMSMSRAEYTWLRGDDDYMVPTALGRLQALLGERRPSAVVTGTAEVQRGTTIDYAAPLWPQLASLVTTKAGLREWAHADAFFGAKFYDLPVPAVVYRTAETLATDYHRYIPTHHAHIGALFDALALEEAERGGVDVVELLEVCSVSLTSIALSPRGKEDWVDDIFMHLAHHGFPRWFEMLPAIYQPLVPAALAHHRHIFRAAFEGGEGAAGAPHKP
jgi:glycosyltransferase involved in cell wall biosynthesis